MKRPVALLGWKITALVAMIVFVAGCGQNSQSSGGQSTSLSNSPIPTSSGGQAASSFVPKSNSELPPDNRACMILSVDQMASTLGAPIASYHVATGVEDNTYICTWLAPGELYSVDVVGVTLGIVCENSPDSARASYDTYRQRGTLVDGSAPGAVLISNYSDGGDRFFALSKDGKCLLSLVARGKSRDRMAEAVAEVYENLG